MNFYEYHLHPEIDIEGMLRMLENMGWKGACFVCKSLEAIEQVKKILEKTKSTIDVSFGYKIEASPEHVPVTARKVRKRAELVLVHGGDLEVNRKACETPEVDVLAHPEQGRNDGGLDYVMAKMAKKNGVAIEFNFRSLFLSYKKTRSDAFSKMLENAELVRKYKTPFILTSGAVEPYDLRSPSELLSFARLLGLNSKQAKLSLSGRMLEENRKRLGGKWVMPGVEVE
jgi:ribonuclease P/MRP protein subunit RPP1